MASPASDAAAVLASLGSYSTLLLSWAAPAVLQVSLRIGKLNAMSQLFWKEIRNAFTVIASCGAVRCVLLTAEGKLFTAGLDLGDHVDVFSGSGETDAGRRFLRMRPFITAYQQSFTVLENLPQPVIAAVHGACIGGGVDLITAADIRWASSDAFFSVKEVDVGMAADVGTLQRLPKIIGSESLVREWCFTGRRITATEALQAGLLSRVLPSKEALHAEALKLCVEIAAKSPLAVTGTKHLLNYSRDHTVAESSEHVALWNAVALQSSDVGVAMQANISRQQPIFSNL
jgi:delta(3,5)-delta(2,4)-dienoyl-CoA isomerase